MKNNISSFKMDHRIRVAFTLIVSIALFSCNNVSSGSAAENASANSAHEATVLSERIFFLLHEIENTPGVKKAVANNDALTGIHDKERKAALEAVDNCPDMDCLVKTISLSEEENQAIAASLGALYKHSDPVQDFIKDRIRPSHAYALSADLPDSALLAEAWEEERSGLNYILHAYLQNEGLHYAKIDSARYDVDSRAYLDTVKQVIKSALHKGADRSLFFQPTLDICLAILQLNDRDEAARFIPLSGVNQKAYEQIPKVDWSNYDYSSVLIFGEGPVNPGVAISPNNKERCRAGAEYYRKGAAPFIIVSGGYVHPYQTKYCEAEEMKRFLKDSLNIPAEAVIMEPHARHTTTNIRNAARIIFKQDIPADKPVLGVTSKSHIDYIADKRFEKACMRDMGYLPFTGLERLSDQSVVFYPSIRSMQVNATTPLDP